MYAHATKPSPDSLLVAHDACEVGRKADAVNIMLDDGLTLHAALHELTPVRPPQLGDILECSWGYEQTRVDFYQVVKLTAKTVTLREIRKQYVSHGRGPGVATVAPVRDAFDEREKPLTNRRFSYGGWSSDQVKWKYSVRVTDFSHAYLWDGDPCHESGEH